MADEITGAEHRRRTAVMRALSDDDRRAAIDASPNVIGFDRFADVTRRRDLSEAYRAPRA